MIRKEGGKYYIYSMDGKKRLSKGYTSKEEAMKRMKEIEHFKKMDSHK